MFYVILILEQVMKTKLELHPTKSIAEGGPLSLL